MNKEIIKAVTKSGETYLAYASLRNEHWNIRKAIIDIVNKQLETTGKELGLKMLEEFAGQSKAGDNYFYTTPAMEAQNLRFGLRCGDSEYRNFAFGFAYIDSNLKSTLHSPVIALVKEAFAEQFHSNEFWHTYALWNHRPNWNDETMAAIISGEFAPDLDALIRKLAKVAVEASRAYTVTPLHI